MADHVYKVEVQQTQIVPGFAVVEADHKEEAYSKIRRGDETIEYKWDKTKKRLRRISAVKGKGRAVVIPFRWTNRYEHCEIEWSDEECDSMHNDKCPVCNQEIEPVESIDNITGAVVDHCPERKVEEENRAVKIVAVAREQYEDEGTLEIDRDDLAIEKISEPDKGKENGAYVKAWVWVDFSGTEFDRNKPVQST